MGAASCHVQNEPDRSAATQKQLFDGDCKGGGGGQGQRRAEFCFTGRGQKQQQPVKKRRKKTKPKLLSDVVKQWGGCVRQAVTVMSQQCHSSGCVTHFLLDNSVAEQEKERKCDFAVRGAGFQPPDAGPGAFHRPGSRRPELLVHHG